MASTPAPSRAPALAALLVVLLVVGAVALYSSQRPSTSSAGSSSDKSTGQSAPSTSNSWTTGTNESQAGLDLIVATNATIRTRQNLSITITLFNGLSRPLNLTPSNNWAVNGLFVSMWPGCVGPPPIEFMVVKGNYTAEGLSVASADPAAPKGPGGCLEGGELINASLQAKSSLANVTYMTLCNPCHGQYNLETNFTVSGYWAYPINQTEANDIFEPPHPACYSSGVPDCLTFNYPEVGPLAQHLFDEGWYTLVVTDEWGQVSILHFDVTD